MLFADEQRYKVVSQGTELDVNQEARSTLLQNYKRIGTVGLLLAWVSLTLYLATAAFDIPLNRQPRFSSCGNSTASARERGCFFDTISFSWQTPECFTEPLVSEFSAWKNWTYYTEKRGNVTVPTEVALLGKSDLWVTWEYHMVHCTFVWRQAQYGYERGWIDAHVRSYPHTLHCQTMLLLEGIANDDNMILVNLQYPVCEKVGTGKNRGKMAPEFSHVGHHPPPPLSPCHNCKTGRGRRSTDRK